MVGAAGRCASLGSVCTLPLLRRPVAARCAASGPGSAAAGTPSMGPGRPESGRKPHPAPPPREAASHPRRLALPRGTPTLHCCRVPLGYTIATLRRRQPPSPDRPPHLAPTGAALPRPPSPPHAGVIRASCPGTPPHAGARSPPSTGIPTFHRWKPPLLDRPRRSPSTQGRLPRQGRHPALPQGALPRLLRSRFAAYGEGRRVSGGG